MPTLVRLDDYSALAGLADQVGRARQRQQDVAEQLRRDQLELEAQRLAQQERERREAQELALQRQLADQRLRQQELQRRLEAQAGLEDYRRDSLEQRGRLAQMKTAAQWEREAMEWERRGDLAKANAARELEKLARQRENAEALERLRQQGRERMQAKSLADRAAERAEREGKLADRAEASKVLDLYRMELDAAEEDLKEAQQAANDAPWDQSKMDAVRLARQKRDETLAKKDAIERRITELIQRPASTRPTSPPTLPPYQGEKSDRDGDLRLGPEVPMESGGLSRGPTPLTARDGSRWVPTGEIDPTTGQPTFKRVQ